jgi:hypothetical protein
VANVEAKNKMEEGPPERQRRLLSGFWTYSLSTTFPKIPSLRSYSLTSLEGEEEEERERWREIRFLDFLSFQDFSRNPIFLGEVEQTPVAASGSLKNSAGKYVVENGLVASVEAKKKMEKGPPDRQRQLLSGFWTFSLSTTSSEIPSLQSSSLTSLEGEEEEERKRWRKIRFLEFLSFHDFSRNLFFLGKVEQTPVAAGGSLNNSAGK